MRKIRKELIGKTASFNKGEGGEPFILRDISEIRDLDELRNDSMHKNIVEESEISRGLIYGVEGVLAQPRKEAQERLMTVYVYLDTEIKVLEEEKSWSSYGHYY